MPGVSVILPVYNGAEFVTEAIDSALAQTRPADEIIVVDDGSTDATPAILARYRTHLTVVRQANRGLSAARNRGIEAALGTFVALLDADDRWDPAFLEVMVGHLAGCDAQVVAAFSGWAQMDRQGREFAGQRTVRGGELTLADVVLGCRIVPSAAVLRRAAVLAAGGFDPALPAVEDWDLWLRILTGGQRIVTVARCLSWYRLLEDSMSRNAERMRAGRLRALEKLYARTDLPAAIQALRPAALAHAYASSSAQRYAAGAADGGAHDLCAAVRHWPPILTEDETYYAIVCAEQPLGRKATRHDLDLDAGARRILAALGRCSEEGLFADAALRRVAHGRALRCLARLAYGQRRMGAARRYATQAIAADPRLCLDWPTVGTMLKSLAGGRVVEAASGWRRVRTDGANEG